MALLAALITGACTLIGQFIASGRSLRWKPGSLRLTWRGVLGILLVVVGSVSMFFFVRHLITQSPTSCDYAASRSYDRERHRRQRKWPAPRSAVPRAEVNGRRRAAVLPAIPGE